jgi:hypothetical protein
MFGFFFTVFSFHIEFYNILGEGGGKELGGGLQKSTELNSKSVMIQEHLTKKITPPVM